MAFFRNPEVRNTLLVYAALTLLAAAATLAAAPALVPLVCAICGGFVAVYWIATYQRYLKIQAFAEDIHEILIGKEPYLLEEYVEGELGILQNEVKKLTLRLQEQQQLLTREKTYLADSLADISHQIKTPLTSIHLLLSTLGASDLPEPQRLQALRELHGLVARIEWLISVLLKLSRLDAGAVRLRQDTHSMKALLQKAAEPLWIPMELKDQQLTLHARGTFCGDLEWTAEALSNILKNCAEHTPEHGSVTVNASENPLYSEITVHDTGRGFAREEIPHLFERFYKGKDAGAGSYGIGLAFAKQIITAQNGDIQAKNHAEGGALFVIRFHKGTI